MRGDRFGAVRRDVVRLFEGDSVAGLGEGDLLARFATARDEAAFEALVTRLGPMVLGVARRMLSDPHDVEDVFQATFLVLVKKAGSIRDRDLVAPWLHGVASKVARRARAESARRKARERVAMVPEAVEDRAGVESGWLELRGLIDEEIGRLPEAHRRAVVLCDVEGLSREEAALRLGWSLNMVRGRLERARGRLRGRLARRGLAPSGGWMALMVAPPTPSPLLLSTTVRVSLAFASGRMATGLASASAVALSRGVLRMMMLSKLKVGLAALVSAGFVAGGSGMLAAQGPGDKPAAEPVVQDPPGAAPQVYKTEGAAYDLPALRKSRVEMARKRWETQKASYDEGRITVDRLLNASQTLMDAEIDALDTSEPRSTLIKAHLDRIKVVEARELAELEVGRATRSDVEEIQTYRLDAEFRMANEAEGAIRKDMAAGPKPPGATRSSLDQERVAIARRLYDQAKRLHSSGEASVVDLLDAEITLAKAEEGVARSVTDRVAAVRTQIDRLQQIVAATEKLATFGEAKTVDVDRARLRLLDAESHLLDVSGTPDGADDPFKPASRGPIPTSGPGTSKSPENRELSPLAKAIAAFNAEATRDEFGRDQPPLTEDEVIAAVRIWKPVQGTVVSKELQATLDAISEAKGWPDGTDLASFNLKFNGKDFHFYGWWVSIMLPNQMGKSRGITVRERLIRSVTYEEALAKAEADLKDPSSPAVRTRLEARVKALKQKILER